MAKEAKAKKEYSLDLKRVLHALDTKDYDFYSKLSEDEKKAYSPLVLIRYMSTISDKRSDADITVLYVNDLVNLIMWSFLKNHKELLHKLLCITGTGSNQYHQYIKADTKKKKTSSVIEAFFIELYPGINNDEMALLKNMYNTIDAIKELAIAAGKSDAEIKSLVNDFKAIS